MGAYESTPLEIAAAYTVFANQGVYVQPHMVSYVLGDGGEKIYSHSPVTHRALTPQVAYLMVNLLEEVLRSGTGAGVRARGFSVPAAGKTGTSRDGWFAGFTSDLICVVWVGFDDHRDLKLEGAKSALPIWTEFMKQAVALMGPPKSFQAALRHSDCSRLIPYQDSWPPLDAPSFGPRYSSRAPNRSSSATGTAVSPLTRDRRPR